MEEKIGRVPAAVAAYSCTLSCEFIFARLWNTVRVLRMTGWTSFLVAPGFACSRGSCSAWSGEVVWVVSGAEDDVGACRVVQELLVFDPDQAQVVLDLELLRMSRECTAAMVSAREQVRGDLREHEGVRDD